MNPDVAADYVGGLLIFQDLLEKKLVKSRIQT
jgi:hypothetical protein